MNVSETLGMSIAALRTNKLRSVLTMLGVAIGVFSIIGVMTPIMTYAALPWITRLLAPWLKPAAP